MSNEEILEKAIKKAINNGWKYKGHNITSFQMLPTLEEFIITTDHQNNIHNVGFIEWALPYYYIFNHDFAKSLWSENGKYWHNPMDLDRWEWHLQQMVIADDPFIYLKENM